MDNDKVATLEEFLSRTRGKIETIEHKYHHDYNGPIGWEPGTATYTAHLEVQQRAEVKLTCDLEMLVTELERIREYRELMFDPETKQLVDQARFIKSLKGRRYG